MMKTVLLGAMILSVLPAASQPVPSVKEVPEVDVYIPYCVKQEGNAEGQFNSNIDKYIAGARCVCQYEIISKKPTVSLEEYTSATLQCHREFAKTGRKFIVKYLPGIDEYLPPN